MLHTETVLAGTLDLLRKLQSLEGLAGLRLVGGTALALHLGHRKSVDLDLFGHFDERDVSTLSTQIRCFGILFRAARSDVFR